jgi:hypothetical protein
MAMLTQPEVIAIELMLRPWQESDLAAVLAAYADPAIQRWHCQSMTEREAADWVGSWPSGGR